MPRLLNEEDDVRVLTRDPSRAEALRELGAQVMRGDLTEGDRLRAAVDSVESIVHLAAADVSADETAAVTRQATIQLAHVALEAGVKRFVFGSTNLVYGSGCGRPAREDDQLAPAGAYPESKAAAEHELSRLCEGEGLGVRTVRLAFVYGEGDPHLRESLLWARDWPLHKRLHLVHHADAAQALLRLLYLDGLDGETFNIADDAPVTAYELLQINREAPAPDASERRLDDPWDGILETAKSRRVLGFRPLYPSIYTARDAGAL